MQRSMGSYEKTNFTNEEVCRLIVENINDYAVILMDSEGCIENWNTGIGSVLNYSEDEFVGQSIALIFTPEDRAAEIHQKELKKAAEQGFSEDKRWHQRKSGTRFWANGKVIALKNADGTLRGFAKIMRDDTAKKLADEYLERVLSGVTDSFFRFDRDFRYVFVNRATTEMFGISEKDFLGKTLWEHFPEVEDNIFHREAQRSLKEQKTVVFENHYKPLNRWFENRIYPSPDGLSVFTTEITERKKVENSLVEAEKRYRALIEATSTTVWHATPGGELTFVGEKWAEISGQTFEEILRWGWLEAIHPDDREHTTEIWRDSLRNKTLYETEFRVLTVSGEYHWFAVSAVPVLDTEGNVQEWIGLNMDINERKKADTLLRESEARFRNMADNAPVMIWVTEADGTCTYLSQSWYDFTGQTPETGLAFGWIDATHPDDKQFAQDTFVTANEKRTTFRVEYRLRRRDGSYAWAIDSAQPRFSESGDFLGYVGSVIDITERKKSEEALLERAKLATLYGDIGNALVQSDSLPNLLNRCTEILVGHLDVAFARIWTLEENEKVLELSASSGMYTHLDGLYSRVPVGELRIGRIAQEGKPHLTNDVIHDPCISDLECAEREGLQAFAGYPLIVEDRLVGVLALFSKHPMSGLTLEAMETVSKGIASGIERKQTEDKRRRLLSSEQEARQTAENANRLKDEFLATLSHELRTPLNAILGWSQILKTRKFDEFESRKAFSTIERSARAQNQLIDDLLDVSRIITGKLRLDVRAVELPDVISAAVDAARPAAEAKNIRLQTLIDPQAGPISGDPDRLQQIVWNLLSNAVKFTPKDGRVQIQLERVNSHVEIVISDTGKGIEPEFLPYVFDRFRQSDGSMTRRHGGLGLGLAIVRQLVELHGGTVTVISAGEGQGATFTVFLPLLPVRTEPVGDEQQIHPSARTETENSPIEFAHELEGVNVLLVEDEADSRDLLKVVLASSGAHVTTANSAGEAFEKIKIEKFDVIVSDIGMPDEDGFSLIGKIRNLPDDQNGTVPAIALTAYARAEDRIRALRSGFQLHIAKPVEPTELVAAVANLAGRI